MAIYHRFDHKDHYYGCWYIKNIPENKEKIEKEKQSIFSYYRGTYEDTKAGMIKVQTEECEEL